MRLAEYLRLSRQHGFLLSAALTVASSHLASSYDSHVATYLPEASSDT